MENNYKTLTNCPFCQNKLTKKGQRKNKYETIQIYFCKFCNKKITPKITKNKNYPTRIIIDSLTLHNQLNNKKEIINIIKEKYGINLTVKTISNWIEEYEKYTPFNRFREFIKNNYKKQEIIEESKMFHQQIYDFKYHKAKLDLILKEDFKNQKFNPLQEFLNLIIAKCPHKYFQNPSKRCSEYKKVFNLDQVKITPKNNTAVKIANFILQSVSNNKERHETLQDFMLTNDSTTIAVEIPILINNEDIKHYKNKLNFDIPINLKENEYITGHIDFLQIRNGVIHILDYKPNAKKNKPIEQLTIYALALAKLTGLRLFNFKCAYFDHENYFEFYPLHIVYKKHVPT